MMYESGQAITRRIEMNSYTKFYGFSVNPFSITTDPKFFFPAESHKEALATMWYGINERKGFILILGEEGIGKTTLIHKIITMYHLHQSPYFGLVGKNTSANHTHNNMGSKVKIVLFHRGQITFEKLFKEILVKLKLPLKSEIKGSMMHELYHYLIHSIELGENVVVIIDEAHNISLEAIEELRLLSNLETSKSKLLQIVLVGKPELNKKLRAEVVRQIRQRIVVNWQISPLTHEESMQYINHRLNIAGSSSSEVFTDKALDLICRHAKGIPRAINVLCSNALSIGYNLSEKKISASIVRKIRNNKELLTPRRVDNLSLGIKKNLFQKISYVFLALVVLALATFLGKDSIEHIITKEKLNKLIDLSILWDKGDTSTSKGTRFVIPEIDSSRPGTDVAATPHKTLQTSTPSAITMDRLDTGIQVKTTVEAKAGTYLSLLALEHYNVVNTTLIDHILELNPEITDPNLIPVKQKIKIPEITESLLVKQSSDGTCTIHLATFSNHRHAARYVNDIDFKGKEVKVVPLKVSRTDAWYRVMAGPFSDRGEALKAVDEMKKKDLLPSFQQP